MKLSVIIPMYKEQQRAASTAERLTECLQNEDIGEFEIIFVSDGSPDRSAEIIENITEPHIKLVKYDTNMGKGYAVRTGMLAATGDIRIFTDCDLAYGTEPVTEMYRLMQKEPDTQVYIASRAIHPEGYADYTWFRRLLSRGYYSFIRMLTGLRLTDSQSGLKGLRAEAAQTVFPLCEVNRFAFDLELLMISKKLGYRISEMPAKIVDNGTSSISLSDPFRMIRDVLRMKKRIKKLDVNSAKC